MLRWFWYTQLRLFLLVIKSDKIIRLCRRSADYCGKLYFPKMTATVFPSPQSSVTRTLPWRGGCLCSLLLNLDGFVTNGNHISRWLLRTSYKNLMDFSVFLLRCSFLKPSHHTCDEANLESTEVPSKQPWLHSEQKSASTVWVIQLEGILSRPQISHPS